MIYVKFYNNTKSINEQKPKEIFFKSFKSLNLFIEKYKYYGGINQFNYDVIEEIPTINKFINKLKYNDLFNLIIK